MSIKISGFIATNWSPLNPSTGVARILYIGTANFYTPSLPLTQLTFILYSWHLPKLFISHRISMYIWLRWYFCCNGGFGFFAAPSTGKFRSLKFSPCLHLLFEPNTPFPLNSQNSGKILCKVKINLSPNAAFQN